jgi:formamidopyrimidine-DNA glycosylase
MEPPVPEGPECKRTTSQLNSEIAGWSLSTFYTSGSGRYATTLPVGGEAFYHDLVTNGPNFVSSIECKGKFIYWKFQRNEWSMWNTLGMSGGWSSSATKHEALCVDLVNHDASKTKSLSFNDVRHFGTIKFAQGHAELEKKLKSLGHDPFVNPPTNIEMQALLKKHANKQITQLLMNQTCFAGVGNYIKSEALYLAGISPKRLCKDVNTQEATKLRDAIVSIMFESYKSGGATIATYADVYGNIGTFSSRFMVYGRKTDPQDNQVIREDTLDKRTSWYVPKLQN